VREAVVGNTRYVYLTERACGLLASTENVVFKL